MRAGPWLALVLAAACGRRERPPELLAPLPDFSMRAIASKTEPPFGRKEMLGSVWIVDFIFTRCGGPCPVLSQGMAGLSKKLPPEVRLLSVTLDPDGDTPPVLREYAAAFGARFPRWVFLRGTAAETRRLLYSGFRQPFSIDPKAPPAEGIVHSTRFVLIDRDGGIRGYYDGLSEQENAALVKDARRLAEAGVDLLMPAY